MKCSNCKKTFEGENFGRVVVDGRNITALDNCSRSCRTDGKIKAGRAPIAGNAGSGVISSGPVAVAEKVAARVLSQSEIRRKMRPKETDISKAIGKQLTDAGVWNTRIQSGMLKMSDGRVIHMSRPGTPDRVFNLGLHVWIEVKRPGETPTPDQVATIAKLKANGSLVFVLDDPADLDFILRELRTWKGSIETINQLIAPIQNRIDTVIKANKIARGK